MYIWFLFGSVALGWLITVQLRLKLSWWLELAFSVALGLFATTWLSYVLATVLQDTLRGLLALTVLLGLPVAWAVRRTMQGKWQSDYVKRIGWVLAVLAPIFFAYWQHAPAPNTMGGITAHGYTWGDLPLHMTLIMRFVVTHSPTLELSLLPNTPLTYPFLVDWVSAVVMRLGGSWVVAIAGVSTLFFACACVFSVELVRRLLGSLRAAKYHLVLFMAMGTAAGTWQLLADIQAGRPIWDTDYASNVASNYTLANPITTHFFPQRSFLFGFMMAMAAMLLFRLMREAKRTVLIPVVAAVIGLLAFVHVHTMAVVGAWFLLTLFYESWFEPALRRYALYSVLIMAALLAPQLWWLLAHLPSQLGHATSGWMWDKSGTLLGYWWRQLGLLVVVIGGGAYLMRRRFNDSFVAAAFLGAIAVLVVGNIRIFQPSDFDNLKLMLYGFWVILLPAAFLLSRLHEVKYAGWVAPVLTLFLTASGAHAIIRDCNSHTSWQLFTARDVAAAQAMQQVIPIDATVATFGRHNNTIAALAGRRVLAGYDGWLWSYGLDYLPATQAQGRILRGEGKADISAFGVDYIAISRDDEFEGRVNSVALRSQYPIVYEANEWTVFKTGN